MGIFKSYSDIRTGIIEKIENENIQFWMKNDILFSKFIQPTHLDVDKTKALITLRHKISDGQKQYWIYNLQNLKDFPKAARDYTSTNGQCYLYATAAIVNSHTTLFIANLYIKLKKPAVPFKAFKNEKLAIEWLNTIKNKNATKLVA
jgi:CDP-glycerol glycerophosphotransferase (TagB/SpsB family)